MFLNLCLHAPSPETVRILTDISIGKKLSDFLVKIDPKLKHKNVHISLTKFFTTLCETEVPGLRTLIIDFEYPIAIYKKNMSKYNVLSSQYNMQFVSIGKNWCQEYLQFIKHNVDQLQLLADDSVILTDMLKTFIDEKGEYILSNPEEYLMKKTSEDMYMNSESPSSYLNMGLGGMNSMGGLGMNVFEDNDKDLLKEMTRYINSGYTEEQKKVGDFSLQFNETETDQDKLKDRMTSLQDPALEIGSMDNSSSMMANDSFITGDELGTFGDKIGGMALESRTPDLDSDMFSQYLKTGSDEKPSPAEDNGLNLLNIGSSGDKTTTSPKKSPIKGMGKISPIKKSSPKKSPVKEKIKALGKQIRTISSPPLYS